MDSKTRMTYAILLLLLVGSNVALFKLYYEPEITLYKDRTRELLVEVAGLENNLTAYNTLLQSKENELILIETENEELTQELYDLRLDYTSISDELDNKIRENTILEIKYSDISSKYDLEKELTIGVSLESYFDSIRNELSPAMYEHQEKVEFCANLVKHSLGRITWTYFEDNFSKFSSEKSYEIAKDKIKKIIDLIGFNTYYSENEKIAKILQFLNEHINYEYEMNELFLSPVETLAFKSGDCDDFSTLCAALLEYLDVECAIGVFVNDQDEYHAMVLVQIEDTPTGFYYYEDLRHKGLAEGRWVIIEPQFLFDYQNDSSLKEWSLIAACEITEGV